MNTDVLVVGAGLSGLHTANLLRKSAIDVLLVEARDRIGGRVHSVKPENSHSPRLEYTLDLGPSWFWPWQTRMLTLINELGLKDHVFTQYSEGLSIAEYRSGQLAQQQGIASMAGSLRLNGGLSCLTQHLYSHVGQNNVLLNSKIVRLELDGQQVKVTIQERKQTRTIHAKRVVLAAPPRVLANHIQFVPSLNIRTVEQMNNTPTWMAGQAKFTATFSRPFWRERGLSGDGVSEIGPLSEVHDASAQSGPPYALFGFVGIPAQLRKNRAKDLTKAATSQLLRMFGDGSETPEATFYKDWAIDDNTSTEFDRLGPGAHVQHSIDNDPAWERHLFWAGSETAPISSGDNGYLEGALSAAEKVITQLK